MILREQCCDLGEARDEVRVVGYQVGNPTSALDPAEGILTLTGRWQSGTFPFAGTGSTSCAEFARKIFR
jgi:dTDP-4-dehydrorhamnose reductase